jgi:hypothetical protein
MMTPMAFAVEIRHGAWGIKIGVDIVELKDYTKISA